MLLEKIKSDLKQAMKAKDETVMSALRMILGEVPRLNKKAGQDVTDFEIETIIRKLVKSELIVLEHSGVDPDESMYIHTLNLYIPELMNKAQVQTWIMDNIDISQFNPKMKAMGSVMKELKGNADGNLVKQVLTEWSQV